MPAKKKNPKGVKMSLNDFLSDAPSTMSWADEEVVLPSAPMAASNTDGGLLSLDNAPDRKEYMAMRRDQEQRGGPRRDPVPFPTEPPFTAFVGNLPLDTDEMQVRQMFGDSGISSVRLIRNRETDRLKGFGYVEFETADALKSAVAKDGSELGGRALRIDVSEARDHHDRPEDPLANTSNWRRSGAAGPMESPSSPFESRSSSGYGRTGGFDRSTSGGGFDRSASGFGRSSSGFGRAPREPAPPTEADEDIDWRAHKNPPVVSPPRGAPASGGEGNTTPRRAMFTGDRFSRSSSGAGESRDEPKNWRRENNVREPRRPRDRSGSREPRVSAGDQEPSWRTAKQQEPNAEDAKPQEKQKPAAEKEDGWNQVEKPVGRRAGGSGGAEGRTGANRDREGSDLRSPPRSTERRNGGGSFFQRQQQQNREGSEDAGNWRRA
ncbi:Eukaryotic translation initiation factor 4B [Coemansia sp. RSA 1813]|nr:Eukaryotic translation initiation factor 4B [Coemansia sp. RSA 1646]KAJ1774100.1 Eukaryotic translation initiation factor 4B [Coemansia sp. RSA 1843]KAJ2092508.1 Eukaryotic translation initiation factor 4B [Coemansia sp. RSA 986]KAJ2216797.1 Eukaryotic translation initiation factor 4B [Coemansia sp. RSA 487]KAJ2572869.1 Eukaryotic translation initiation factor 4B [Coemansia sp. RSA 1813]